MPSPYLCERFHPTRGCVSPNFRPETTFSKVAGRVRTADLQTRRLPLNPLLHGGLTDFFYIGLRRLSATLDEMEEKANDSQSEDEDKMESYGEESEKVPTEDSKSNEADEDSIQLGEEGKEFTRYINLNQLTAAKTRVHIILGSFCFVRALVLRYVSH